MKREDRRTIDEILEDKEYKAGRRREWGHLLFECAVIVIAVYILFQYVIGVTVVNGDSMEPYLYDEELVLFYRLESYYMEGDVVVLKGAGEDNVKLISSDEETEAVSSEGVMTVDEAKEAGIAGRVVLHIGFEGG